MSEHRLNEIVIERPRGGLRFKSTKLKGVQKALNRLTEIAGEDGLLSPYLIKTKIKTKYLSDHLGPLRRFLRSKVGQPWDKVYSELRQRLDRNTVTGLHVLDHLWGYVYKDVEIIDGEVYYKPGTIHFRGGSSRGEQFYIHPETGILSLGYPNFHRHYLPVVREKIVIDAYHEYCLINGFWYEVEYQDFPPTPAAKDVILERVISRKESVSLYHKEIYSVDKSLCTPEQCNFLQSLPLEKLAVGIVKIDTLHHYRLLKGRWYEVTFDYYPKAIVVRDVLLEANITSWDASCKYNRPIYAAKKRQCSKKEVQEIMIKIEEKEAKGKRR